MRFGRISRSSPLVIHTWKRPRATSRLDCWSSASSVPLSGFSDGGGSVSVFAGVEGVPDGSPEADDDEGAEEHATRLSTNASPATYRLTTPTLPASARRPAPFAPAPTG